MSAVLTLEAGQGYDDFAFELQVASLRQPVRALLITSCRRVHGRTGVTVDMARAFARGGTRTLVVDADFAEPHFHPRFDVAEYVGLAQLLDDPFRDPDSAVRKVEEDLFVLGSGVVGGVRGYEGAWDRVMAALRSQFDLLVLDGPPVLSGHGGQLLVGQADGAVLVVEKGATPKQEVKEAASIIDRHARKLKGVVLTG